ncbi:copper amine oxidase N-terminal domain-containing protein [Peptococcaceae bacterium 1198_IL3148]
MEGEQINFDAQPVIDGGRTLVPFRQIFEALGAEVDYDSHSKVALGTKDDVTIELPINQALAYINDEKLELDVATQVLKGRTMVPLRFIGESLGYEVEAKQTASGLKIYIGEDLQSIDTAGQELNSYVLDIIDTYEIGKYPYLMNGDYNNYNGVTTNLVYQDKIIAKANPRGDLASHCVGITFEVFFKAMQQRNEDLGISVDNFNDMTWQELQDFMLTWYVAKGDKSISNVAVAVEKYGLGKRIGNIADAQPGDFVDISRENNTGHTVIFIDAIKKDGQIVGFKYWSSQESTNGIAYKTEYFNLKDQNGNKYGNVMADKVYIARVSAVADYQ